MSLVDDNVFPLELLEGSLLSETHLVRGDADVEVSGEELVVDDFGLRRSKNEAHASATSSRGEKVREREG